jgi:hypothetical protein
MDYPNRTRKNRKKAPKADRGEDRLELKLAEYSAPFGEELPWRVATDELVFGDAVQALRPERGRLH